MIAAASLNILITGGTGLIGRALCRQLLSRGHRLTVLSRQPERVATLCGAGVRAWSSLDHWMPGLAFDAVINLAGEPIADRRWSAVQRERLRDSRVGLTAQLVERMRSAQRPPASLISGSAIGYYGHTGDREIDESQPAGADFSARLCNDWEQAALVARGLGTRVVQVRTGLVLDATGGVLGRMLAPFRLGLGTRLGSGEQWMSWIHIEDHVSILVHLLEDPEAHGAYNLTAPQPVRNAEFTTTLARTLHRPAWAVAPAALLSVVLGERASLLLDSQRVLPERLLASGWTFKHPRLGHALSHLLATASP